jgi:hypothetical protein
MVPQARKQTRATPLTRGLHRRVTQEVSAIHELRDGDHRRHHGAFLMNIGNQGWEWAGPNLAALAKGFVDAGLSGSELLNAVRSHASREMTLVALTEQLPDPDNRITPDFDRLDAIGVPKPRVFFRLDPYTATALAAARKTHEQLFRAIGATEIGHLPHAEGAGQRASCSRRFASALALRSAFKPKAPSKVPPSYSPTHPSTGCLSISARSTDPFGARQALWTPQ